MAASATVQREPVGLVVVAILSVALVAVALVALVALVVLRRLPAGDEGRQAVDVAAAFRGRAALMTRLVRLVLLVLRIRLRVARQIGLLAGAVRLFAHSRRLAVVLALVEGVVACAGHGAFGTSEVRIVLAELLLRGGDQAVVVFGVLVVVLGRDRITGRLRVARKLHVLFSDVRGVSAYFDVRAVRLVDPRHGIVTFTVASAHALVLTVSHDSPVCKSLHYGGPRRPAFHQLPNYSRRE
jgi:hypothetical protein